MNKFLFFIASIMFLAGVATIALAGEMDRYEDVDFVMVAPMSEKEAMAWLAKHTPQLRAELDELKKMDPELFEEYLDFLPDLAMSGEDVRLNEPEMFPLFVETERMELKTDVLSMKYHMTNNASQRKALRAELTKLVTQLFDKRLQQHNAMIRDIEEDLQELKTEGKKKKKNRDKIIARHIEDLLGADGEDLSWW